MVPVTIKWLPLKAINVAAKLRSATYVHNCALGMCQHAMPVTSIASFGQGLALFCNIPEQNLCGTHHRLWGAWFIGCLLSLLSKGLNIRNV